MYFSATGITVGVAEFQMAHGIRVNDFPEELFSQNAKNEIVPYLFVSGCSRICYGLNLFPLVVLTKCRTMQSS